MLGRGRVDHHEIVDAEDLEGFIDLNLNGVVQVTDGVNPAIDVNGSIKMGTPPEPGFEE